MQPGESLKDEALYTAEAALRVLVGIMNCKKLECLDTICECIKNISIVLSFLYAGDENIDERDEAWSSSKAGKLLTDLIDVMKRCLKKHMADSIPCYDLESTDQEVKVKTRSF